MKIIRRQNHYLTEINYFRFFYTSSDYYEKPGGFGIEVLAYQGEGSVYEEWSPRNMAQQMNDEEAEKLFKKLIIKHKGGRYNYFIENINGKNLS